MRLITVFLLVCMLLFLVACYPRSAEPVEIVLPVVTTLIATNTPQALPATKIPDNERRIIPTPTVSPTLATITTEAKELPMPVTQPLTITVVYDNRQDDPRLGSAWGFSAWVEYHNHVLLFDTGGDGQLLMENMRILKLDPNHIDSVVLSHAHGDHTGGLSALLNTGADPLIYLLPSFPASFKHQVEQITKVIEVSPGQSFAEGLFTTGEMGGTIPEQALLIQTEQGLVIITGCAHPGIVAIVEQARKMVTDPVRLVLGGFHLGNKTETEISKILKDFRHLEVEQVAPCHCTGEKAISMFAVEYGEDFIPVGVGSVIK